MNEMPVCYGSSSNVESVLVAPICDVSLKPHEGKCFSSLDEAMKFYEEYASNVGFDTRIFGSKIVDEIVTWRYVVCTREGKKHTVQDDIENDREGYVNKCRRRSIRCECKARIVFKYVANSGYVVDKFLELHNHEMVAVEHKRFMRVNRKLDPMHQEFIVDCVRSTIGPTLTFKLLNEFLGGYDNVGCTVVDVRNYTRDMKAYINGSDAQMLLNEMSRKKELFPSFFYEVEVDNEDKLKRLFWCDEISRKNYHIYGDVVAFDTTYSTNKYCMIFAPFTGKDNHGKPVTFASGLVSREDADSFSWLFTKFSECMGNNPRMIITDQDLGMKAAIERVMPDTRHRWCMWHIMIKLSDKVSKELHANEEFRTLIKSCVWSDLIEPEEFEVAWSNVMNTFGITDVDWFKVMYRNRSFWVPAYFRDFHMGGVMRTTSISESENNFFKRYTKSRANLIEFIMGFNRALEAQRQQACKLDFMDQNMVAVMACGVEIERQAATLYTDSIFKDVQGELVDASFKCRIVGLNIVGYNEQFTVVDGKRKSYVVVYDSNADTFSCQCKMFSRIGLLCRHVFFVLRNKEISVIPDKYIVRRWLKTSLVNSGDAAGSGNSNIANDRQKLKNKVYSTFFGIVQKLDGDAEKMSSVLSTLQEVEKSLCVSDPGISSLVQKRNIIQGFYGNERPDNISGHPPNVVKTKGSGSRIISRIEKIRRDREKPLRKCKKCDMFVNHDSRNCDKLKDLEKQKE